MNVEIVTIGDELLIGQVVDTNSAWMGDTLNKAGFAVKQITSVSDNEGRIIEALEKAKQNADIILITGGLGPTKDDITKVSLCKFFNTHLVFSDEAYAQVSHFFTLRGSDVSDVNKLQAMLPANCHVLHNKVGTAPGMWFNTDGKIFVSMPGVPYEMKLLMTDEVLPRLKNIFATPAILHKTILTQGIGESVIAEKIADIEDALPPYIKLAYLPAVASVRLRLTGISNNTDLENELNTLVADIEARIKPYVYGYDNDTLPAVVGRLLKQKQQTITLAESCTGGYIAHLLTSVPGSSAYFKGSVIAYAYEVKEDMLEVDKQVLQTKGAVSEEVVVQMATQARQVFKSDYALAVSGIAGPDGGTAEKPVGTVWISLAYEGGTVAKRFKFGTDRNRNIEATALTALHLLFSKLIAV
ncbi:MAG: competence/damage-inducible protein A [Bacteroidia bacterium]|nr:competence/damage-inducible protein A [Bacteroidia bacterium]